MNQRNSRLWFIGFLHSIMQFAAILQLGNCQVFQIGVCSDPPPQENFRISKFTGRWYEIERFMSLMQAGTRCVTRDIHLYPNGSIYMVNDGLDEAFGHTRRITAIAEVPNKKEPAIFIPNYFNGVWDFPLENHRVIATDYTRYAITWACQNLPNSKIEHAWILSRKPYLSYEKLWDIHDWLSELGIDPIHFRTTSHRHCYNY